MNQTAYTHSVLVERLLADGDLTEAEFVESEDEDEPAKTERPRRAVP